MNPDPKTGAAGPPIQDKAVDAALNALIAKVGDVKGSLSSFVGKMEHESLTWPSVLDSFAALSGQFSTLTKQLNNEKLPPLHSQILLPQQVSSDRDTDLERSTEGRIPILHHEIVPDYLRTKLDLDLEAKQRELYAEAAKSSPDFHEEVKSFNSLLDKVIASVDEARESWEKQSNRLDTVQPNPPEETRKLVAAYLYGTGLQQLSLTRKQTLMGGRLPVSQPQIQQQQQPVQLQMPRTISRVPAPTGIRQPMITPLGPLPPGFSSQFIKPR